MLSCQAIPAVWIPRHERINFRKEYRAGQLTGLPFPSAGGTPRERVPDILPAGVQSEHPGAAVHQDLYMVRLREFLQAHTVDPHFQPAERKDRFGALKKELTVDDLKSGIWGNVIWSALRR